MSQYDKLKKAGAYLNNYQKEELFKNDPDLTEFTESRCARVVWRRNKKCPNGVSSDLLVGICTRQLIATVIPWWRTHYTPFFVCVSLKLSWTIRPCRQVVQELIDEYRAAERADYITWAGAGAGASQSQASSAAAGVPPAASGRWSR